MTQKYRELTKPIEGSMTMGPDIMEPPNRDNPEGTVFK